MGCSPAKGDLVHHWSKLDDTSLAGRISLEFDAPWASTSLGEEATKLAETWKDLEAWLMDPLPDEDDTDPQEPPRTAATKPAHRMAPGPRAQGAQPVSGEEMFGGGKALGMGWRLPSQ
jgi:hypothetical protein